MTAVVWLRHDLRIRDNPSLLAAARSGLAIVPLYILDNSRNNPWPPGRASRWWLARSLDSLMRDLDGIGSRLILKHGDPLRVLSELRPSNVYWNECHEPWIRDRDKTLRTKLRHLGIRVEVSQSSTLFDAGSILTANGRPYRVYTAFARACGDPDTPLPAPARLPPPDRWPDSDWLDPRPRRSSGLGKSWKPGSNAARSRLTSFNILDYADARDLPGVSGTSRLSPHLHCGEISAREIWNHIRSTQGPGADKFRSELLWREFAHHLLHHYPNMTCRPLQERFLNFPCRDDPEALSRWQQGTTGYPIVDAGMRELRESGWMHNRVRMIVGSFLTKHLLLDWRNGARWFWDTLVDADLANNTTGWQWIAGCGADAVPYFRIFNPVLQGEKFDPDGAYVRHWVPELAELPTKFIHRPWTLPVPPGNYPSPIVDHRFARERALAAFRTTGT